MIVRRRPVSRLVLLGVLWCVVFGGTGARGEGPVGFYDHVKPVLAVHCYRCHGPDTAKSGVRLDRREGAVGKAKSGAVAVVPGDHRRSELLRRIASHDPNERMPPEGAGLTAAEVERIGQWIDQG